MKNYIKVTLRIFVISTKEKSSREALQRLDFRYGVTCGDFSFVEMTMIVVILYKTKFPHIFDLTS